MYGLIYDDPKFRDAVKKRKNEMILHAENGKRIPLYTNSELRNAEKHRKPRKHNKKTSFQPELFREELSIVRSPEGCGHETVIDPEKNLARLHKEFEKPPYRYNRNSLVGEDIKYNKLKLRKVVGLPIARGDRFYKFLVKRIVKLDVFGIFSEYNGIKNDETTDLDVRISQVKTFVDKVLNNKNIGLMGKIDEYKKFKNDYDEEWNINLT